MITPELTSFLFEDIHKFVIYDEVMRMFDAGNLLDTKKCDNNH